MKYVLILLALALTLAACSTPDDLTAPTLEAQFGTPEDDIGLDVASVSTGRIYALSSETGPRYSEWGDEDGFYSKAVLRRYDASGNLTWNRDVASYECDYGEYYDSGNFRAHSLQADNQGHTYTLASFYYTVGDCMDVSSSYVYKLNATGYQLASINVGQNAVSLGGDTYSKKLEIAVDGSGNIYVAGQKATYDDSECTKTLTNFVAKYSTSGTLQWQRTSKVGVPTDITISSTGSVYVVGTNGLARYSRTGGLSWTKTGNFEEVVISGSNLYTRYRKDIRKYDGTGKQLWLRSQSGLNTLVLQAMDGDGSGNVYLAGKYDSDTSTKVNMNAMVRKLSSSGSVLWTKTYGTPAYDDGRGIVTITGSEIYTTGETQGSLAHTNIGGRDGYLRKFSSSGGAVWTR